MKPEKYIHEQNGYYSIQKNINGETCYFGSFKNLDEAKIARDDLIRNNWEDKEKYLHNKPYLKIKDYDNIYKSGNRYYVIKYKNGEKITFGSYITRREAILKAEYFKKNEWNPELVEMRTKKYNKKNNDDMRYIYPSGYNVVKRVNGELVKSGSFRTLKEAKKERDLLEKHDWDYSKVMEDYL